MAQTQYKDYANFFDRELSWLAFNRRVLEEALNPTTPLMERLKFLGITSTNLDEFFMVRVSGVQEQLNSGVRRRSIAGYTPAEQLSLIHGETHKQIDEMYRCYREELVPAMEKHRIQIAEPKALSPRLRKEMRSYFEREIYPVLTPLAIDPGHPFPRLKGLSINIIVHLEGTKKNRWGETLVAIVQVPSVLPRLVPVPCARDRSRYLLLGQFIIDNLDMLFPGMKVRGAAQFRVTRDADIEYKEIEAEDLLKYIESEIRERERGQAVRLEISDSASDLLTSFLMAMLNVTPEQVYRINGPLAINELSGAYKDCRKESLKDEPFTPSIRRELRGAGSFFSNIRNADVLLHHPYQSFAPVVDMVKEAANDPKVLAIKQTLYRTSGDSPIIQSLIEAAENGKQVTALVELKARFDEENNIVWARQLEEAGVHVVYGFVGLKTHAKVLLVVRREDNGIRRYVHLSTGNYNPTTARLYTDSGIITCDPGFADDASELFNLLTGYAHLPKWERMVVAPDHLRDKTLSLIAEQRNIAAKGGRGRIRAKFNSLVDQEIIIELYKASAAGVQIELCIRGICCLRPGIKGISENIKVWSIVDRFLEHSRIFIFGDGDKTTVWLSSADWMDRNMDRRIEVMFPLLDPVIKQRAIDEIFGASALDNVKSRRLLTDGRYRTMKPRASEPKYRSQIALLEAEEELILAEERAVAAASNAMVEQVTEILADQRAATTKKTTSRKARKGARSKTASLPRRRAVAKPNVKKEEAPAAEAEASKKKSK